MESEMTTTLTAETAPDYLPGLDDAAFTRASRMWICPNGAAGLQPRVGESSSSGSAESAGRKQRSNGFWRPCRIAINVIFPGPLSIPSRPTDRGARATRPAILNLHRTVTQPESISIAAWTLDQKDQRCTRTEQRLRVILLL